jgi:predicted RNase H-like HicB family nuclease
MTYTVWVGGIPDYEGESLREAKAIFKEWIDLGYDDVVLEQEGQPCSHA